LFDRAVQTLPEKFSLSGTLKTGRNTLRLVNEQGLMTPSWSSSSSWIRVSERVAADVASARELGISGTPGILVGSRFFVGYPGYQVLEETVRFKLSSRGSR
jgi:hypothetical protein